MPEINGCRFISYEKLAELTQLLASACQNLVEATPRQMDAETSAGLQNRMLLLRAYVQSAVIAYARLVYWSNSNENELWIHLLSRFAKRIWKIPGAGLRKLAISYLYYAGLIACLAADKPQCAASMVKAPDVLQFDLCPSRISISHSELCVEMLRGWLKDDLGSFLIDDFNDLFLEARILHQTWEILRDPNPERFQQDNKMDDLDSIVLPYPTVSTMKGLISDNPCFHEVRLGLTAGLQDYRLDQLRTAFPHRIP